MPPNRWSFDISRSAFSPGMYVRSREKPKKSMRRPCIEKALCMHYAGQHHSAAAGATTAIASKT
eukprot:364870-Chlamydomonas_euryale.AAC.5